MKAFKMLRPCVLAIALVDAAMADEPGETPSGAPHVVHGPGIATPARISLEQALRRAAERAPHVQAAAASGPSARRLLEVSNPWLTQSPMAQVQVGPRWSRGSTTPELVVNVVQPVMLFDQGAAQEAVGRAQVQLSDQELAVARVGALERAGLAWLAVAYSDALVELRRENVENAERILEIAGARLDAGESDPSEHALAQLELVGARGRLLESEGLHFEASAQLAFWTGEERAQHLEASTTSFNDIERALKLMSRSQTVPHPTVRLAQAERDVAKAQISYQKAQQSPQWSAGIQYQREGTGDQILTGVVNIPLPFNRPWSFHEADQRLAYEKKSAYLKVQERELKQDQLLADHEWSHARERHDLLAEQGESAHRERLRVLLARYEAGDIDLSHLSFTRNVHVAAREARLRAEFDVHSAHLRALRAHGALEVEGGRDAP